jgi:hypothetical protein
MPTMRDHNHCELFQTNGHYRLRNEREMNADDTLRINIYTHVHTSCTLQDISLSRQLFERDPVGHHTRRGDPAGRPHASFSLQQYVTWNLKATTHGRRALKRPIMRSRFGSRPVSMDTHDDRQAPLANVCSGEDVISL